MAEDVPNETVEVAETASPLVAMGDEGAPEDWSPPRTDEQGVALDGHGLPLNLRLRAAALSDKGLEEDPVGSVDAETIKAEGARLAAFDKQFPQVSANSKVADLEKVAKAEGVDISRAAKNEERVALIRAARPSRV